jgi:cell division protein FtsA
VVGLGSQPSRGLKKGVVVNIESTVQSIQRAVEEAELMAGCQIHSVYAGIAGSHIRSLNSHGIVAIRDKEVTPADVERVIDAARRWRFRPTRRSCTSCRRNTSSTARKASASRSACPACASRPRCTWSPARSSAAQNIEKCIRALRPRGRRRGAEQLASSYAVLTDDEKELGVCLSTSAAAPPTSRCSSHGAIRHTAVIPIAGDQVTNDIAVALRTPTQYAEDIKIKYACALAQLANPDETIEGAERRRAPARGPRAPDARRVVEPRYDELFTLVQAELRRSGFEE